MKRLRSLLILTAATLSLSSAANAAVLSYTLAGVGTITGTLDGTPFTANSFSITAYGDSTTIQSGNFADLGSTAAQVIEVTAPLMTFNTSTGPITTTLLPFPGASGPLHAFGIQAGTSFSLYGFGTMAPFSTFDFPSLIGFGKAPADSIDLGTPATYSGPMDGPGSYLTTGGVLNLNMSLGSSASFTISAVPEPATATSSLLLSLGGLSLISRRKRKA